MSDDEIVYSDVIVNNESMDCLQKASTIHFKVYKELTSDFLMNNNTYEIANHIENIIKENSNDQRANGIAFPTGININNVVAHYTPRSDEEYYIKADDIVKIDYGVHYDGYIIDSAFTFNFNNKYKPIMEASKESVKTIIKNIGVGSHFCDLSDIADEIVNSYEYEDKGVLKPVKLIENVYGHNIKRWNIHGGKFLYPTVQSDDTQKVEEDEIMAIEIFTSNGSGLVKLDRNIKNYSHYKLKPQYETQNIPLFPIKKMNMLADTIKEYFGTLPFCPRLLNINTSINELQYLFSNKIIDSHPPLIEINGTKSAQFEHTILCTETKVIDYSSHIDLS